MTHPGLLCQDLYPAWYLLLCILISPVRIYYILITMNEGRRCHVITGDTSSKSEALQRIEISAFCTPQELSLLGTLVYQFWGLNHDFCFLSHIPLPFPDSVSEDNFSNYIFILPPLFWVQDITIRNQMWAFPTGSKALDRLIKKYTIMVEGRA